MKTMSSLVPSRLRPALLAAVFGASTAALLSVAAAAADLREVGSETQRDLSLTVYNQDLGLIREQRTLDLTAGLNRLALQDVSARLQPETLLLGGSGFELLNQSYSVDLLTPQRLLQAAVGQTVEVVKTNPETGEETVVEAELLSVAQGPVLRIGDRIETVPPGRIAFKSIPEGLFQRPTLVLELESDAGGTATLDLRYLTGGLSWSADYVAQLNADETELNLTALVTLGNNTGLAFEDARLGLVAGDVNRAAVGLPRPEMAMQADMMVRSAAAPQAMAPQAVSDRYVYEVSRPVDLARGETKQIPLLTADKVAVTRSYRFPNLASAGPSNGEIGPVNADLLLTLDNKQASGLGRPLPAGIVRVYQPAGAGGEIFAGEDRIDHTPEGEEIELRLGSAFDVTARARHTDYERLSDRSFESAQSIVVQNAKAVPVTVEVGGSFPRGWKIVEESVPHNQEGANQVTWTLQVPAGGETELTYRVRVSQ